MLIDDYHIGKKVFEDMIGQIFVASTSDLDKAVYFKILHSHYSHDVELVRAFHHGAELACSLENEDHIRMLTHGHENSKHYAILENFNLTPLNIFLKQKKVFSLIEATELIEKLAEIIRRLHIEDETYGILTPQNIFVDYDLQQIKITNFGFKEFVYQLIRAKNESVVPYLPYYSPEFINNCDAVERQSDIFSLGVLFYRLLVGQTPWSADNFDDYLTEVRQRSVIPPSLQRLEIPDFLDSIILDAIDPDMPKRCPNLSTFIQEVQKAKSSILAAFTPTSQILSATNGEQRLDDQVNTPSETSAHSEEAAPEKNEQHPPDESSMYLDQDRYQPSQQEPDMPQAFSEVQYETSAEIETSVEAHERESAPASMEENEPPSVVTDGETELVNGIEKERGIVSIQEQELDDRPTFKLESPINGKKEEQKTPQQPPQTARQNTSEKASQPQPQQPQTHAQQQAQKTPATPESPPVETLPADIDEAEEYFQETATQTQTVSTTQTVDLNRKQFGGGSLLSIVKIFVLALIPILAIYILVAFTFDLDFSKRLASIFGTNGEPSTSSERRAGSAFEQNPLKGQEVREQPIRTREMTPSESNTNELSATTNRPPQNSGNNRESNSKNLKNGQANNLTQNRGQQPTENGAVNRAVQPKLEIWVRNGSRPLVADIFFNGEFYDRTDSDGRLAIADLRRDSYIVKVDRAGYEMWAKEIQYRGGSQRVDVQLQRESAVSQSAQVQRETDVNSGSDLNEQSNATATPPPNKVDNSATLTIEVAGQESEAFIYVNGTLWQGEDNIAPARLDLPPGSYTIEVRKEGYRPAPPAHTVDVIAGENRTLRFILTPN